MKDIQFKKLIKEALTHGFLKESVNEDSNKHSEWIYPIYFDMNNEYPADAIARVAQGGDIEDIKDTTSCVIPPPIAINLFFLLKDFESILSITIGK